MTGNGSPENEGQTPQPQGHVSCSTVLGAMTLLVVLAMLVLGLLAWMAVGGFFSDVGQGLRDFGESIVELPQKVSDSVEEALKIETRAEVEVRDKLLGVIQPMGMLITARQEVDSKVIVGVREGLLNLCGSSVDHVVEGTVEAGVDLSQISGGDVVRDAVTGRWTLNLGPAQVSSCRIDYIRQQGQSFTLCGKDWDEYRLLAETVVLPQFMKDAKDEGLLEGAEREARIVLSNFLRAVTGSADFEIVFESEPEATLPASCTRESPPGWRYDKEGESWLKE